MFIFKLEVVFVLFKDTLREVSVNFPYFFEAYLLGTVEER